MGGRSSSSRIGASGNTEMAGFTRTAVSQTRDYNEEVIRDFRSLFSETYDDRAYTDPYFDTDEYEDTMDNLIRDARQAVADMRASAENRSYRYWSEDLARQETVDAARLEEIINDYEQDYRRQRLNSRRY